MRAFLSFIGLLILAVPASAEFLSLGVAGGFRPAMQELQKDYETLSGDKLRVSYASVGSLYAQISQGAPFDVFVSADMATPVKLEKRGLAVAGTRVTHSISQLVLWSPHRGLVDDHGAVLHQNRFRHLAIANPVLGVHGQAAVTVMRKMGVYGMVKSRVVEGKNALQALQFLKAGAADLGFVSLSLVCEDGRVPGSYWLVPESLSGRLTEQAVLLNSSQHKYAGRQFLHYLTSDRAKKIIREHGYKIPA